MMNFLQAETLLDALRTLEGTAAESSPLKYLNAVESVIDAVLASTLPQKLTRKLLEHLFLSHAAATTGDSLYADGSVYDGIMKLQAYIEAGAPDSWNAEAESSIDTAQSVMIDRTIVLRYLYRLLHIGTEGDRTSFLEVHQQLPDEAVYRLLDAPTIDAFELEFSAAESAAKRGDISAATARIDAAIHLISSIAVDDSFRWSERVENLEGGGTAVEVGTGRVSDPFYVISDLDRVPLELLTELMSALDELHRAHGGGGLRILRSHTGSEAVEGAAV